MKNHKDVKSEVVAFKVTAAEKKWLLKAAKAQGEKLSQYLRWLVLAPKP